MNPQVRILFENRIYPMFVVLLVASVALIPEFQDPSIAANVFQRASLDAIMAVGMTLLLIAGQLDLSIGSTLALSGIVAIGSQSTVGVIGGVVLGIGVGGLVGVLNGTLVVRLGLNAFVGTLATMIGVRGLAFVITDGRPVRGIDPSVSAWLDASVLGPLTPRLLIVIALFVAAHVWLTWRRSGRDLFAAGGAAEAARLSGVAVERRQFTTFVICGLTAGVAGVMLGLSLNTGSPVVGSTSALSVIAAVVVGGTSMFGGAGSLVKSFFGVLLLAVVATAMNVSSVPTHIQLMALGVILVGVVLIDALYASRRTRLSVASVRTAAASPP